jgi:hypothetical protein
MAAFAETREERRRQDKDKEADRLHSVVLLLSLFASFFISFSRAIFTIPLASSKRLSRNSVSSRALSFARSATGAGT